MVVSCAPGVYNVIFEGVVIYTLEEADWILKVFFAKSIKVQLAPLPSFPQNISDQNFEIVFC